MYLSSSLYLGMLGLRWMCMHFWMNLIWRTIDIQGKKKIYVQSQWRVVLLWYHIFWQSSIQRGRHTQLCIITSLKWIILICLTFTVGFVKLLSTHPIHIVVWGNFPFNVQIWLLSSLLVSKVLHPTFQDRRNGITLSLTSHWWHSLLHMYMCKHDAHEGHGLTVPWWLAVSLSNQFTLFSFIITLHYNGSLRKSFCKICLCYHGYGFQILMIIKPAHDSLWYENIRMFPLFCHALNEFAEIRVNVNFFHDAWRLNYILLGNNKLKFNS